MIEEFLKYKENEFYKRYSEGQFNSKEELLEEINIYISSNFKRNQNGELIISKSIQKEIVNFAEQEKIPLVLNNADMVILSDENNTENPFNKTSDLVAIHKTKIPPKNDRIDTPETTKLTANIVFHNPNTGIDYEIPYEISSNTIHFTLNCPVENHEVGNDWDSYKYAVMIGLNNLDKEKIGDVKSEDTFLEGDVNLGTDYYLFCPLGERNQMQDLNPNATIVEYDGITLNQAISSMIIFSGRKLEPYGGFGWGNDEDIQEEHKDEKYLKDLMIKEKYPYYMSPWFENQPMMFSESKYTATRMWKREYNALTALMDFNRKNNIDMPDDVINLILMYNGGYAFPGTPEVTLEEYKKTVLPILEKHGYHIEEDFFEGLTDLDDHLKMISHTSDGTPIIKCPKWENDLRDRVTQLLKSRPITIISKENNSNKSTDDEDPFEL